MRILIVHNEYGSPSGEEHALSAIAGLLEEKGHHVSWFLRSSSEISGLSGKAAAFFSGVYNPHAGRELGVFLRQQSVDVALVQNLFPFLSPSILPVLKKSGIPVVMRCPNYRLFCPNGLHLSHGKVCERCLGGREYWCILKNCENNLFKSTGYALRNAAARISRRIFDNVDMFVVLSEFQRQRFIESGIAPERLAILPNMAPFTAEIPAEDIGEMVSFVGRVSPEKGIEDFVAAAARLPDISFAVAGDYDQMPDLPKSGPDNIQWMGFLQRGDLNDFYRQSRVLVFPGRWFEGFPNVIAGAMAAGKPVIASGLGAVAEIVEHEKTGLLFDPGNIVELTNAIKRLYTDPDLCVRMGVAGRNKTEIVYSHEAVYKRVLNIFEEVSVLRNST